MNKKEISLVLGTMCVLLVFAIFVQLKTIEKTTTTISKTFANDSLRDEVLRAKDKYDRLYSDLEKEETFLEETRKTVSENDSASQDLESKIKRSKALLGVTELKGKGIKITLDDNKLASAETLGATDSISDYLVHYVDILQIINELRNAGAEAISVNDQRIVSTSAIACVGNVVSINGERVGVPFEIQAIGNPEALYGALTRPESYVKILERYGVIKTITKSDDLKLPKFTGKYTTEYMKNI